MSTPEVTMDLNEATSLLHDALKYRYILNKIKLEQEYLDNPEPASPPITCCFLQRAICDCKEPQP